MLGGTYSKKFQHIEKEHIDHLKKEIYGERHEVISKTKKLSLETNKRRKALAAKKKLEAQKEEKRRQEILAKRREKQQEATERFQRNNRTRTGSYSSPRHQFSPNHTTPALEEALRAVRNSPNHYRSSSYDNYVATNNAPQSGFRTVSARQPFHLHGGYTGSSYGRRDGNHGQDNQHDSYVEYNSKETPLQESLNKPYPNKYGVPPATRVYEHAREVKKATALHNKSLRNLNNSKSLFEQQLEEQQRKLHEQQQRTLKDFNVEILREINREIDSEEGNEAERRSSVSSADSLEAHNNQGYQSYGADKKQDSYSQQVTYNGTTSQKVPATKNGAFVTEIQSNFDVAGTSTPPGLQNHLHGTNANDVTLEDANESVPDSLEEINPHTLEITTRMGFSNGKSNHTQNQSAVRQYQHSASTKPTGYSPTTTNTGVYSQSSNQGRVGTEINSQPNLGRVGTEINSQPNLGRVGADYSQPNQGRSGPETYAQPSQSRTVGGVDVFRHTQFNTYTQSHAQDQLVNRQDAKSITTDNNMYKSNNVSSTSTVNRGLSSGSQPQSGIQPKRATDQDTGVHSDNNNKDQQPYTSSYSGRTETISNGPSYPSYAETANYVKELQAERYRTSAFNIHTKAWGTPSPSPADTGDGHGQPEGAAPQPQPPLDTKQQQQQQGRYTRPYSSKTAATSITSAYMNPSMGVGPSAVASPSSHPAVSAVYRDVPQPSRQERTVDGARDQDLNQIPGGKGSNLSGAEQRREESAQEEQEGSVGGSDATDPSKTQPRGILKRSPVKSAPHSRTVFSRGQTGTTSAPKVGSHEVKDSIELNREHIQQQKQEKKHKRKKSVRFADLAYEDEDSGEDSQEEAIEETVYRAKPGEKQKQEEQAKIVKTIPQTDKKPPIARAVSAKTTPTATSQKTVVTARSISAGVVRRGGHIQPKPAFTPTATSQRTVYSNRSDPSSNTTSVQHQSPAVMTYTNATVYEQNKQSGKPTPGGAVTVHTAGASYTPPSTNTYTSKPSAGAPVVSQNNGGNGDHKPKYPEPTYDANGLRLDRTPTDDEINWLWEKVRTCLNRDSKSSGTTDSGVPPSMNSENSTVATYRQTAPVSQKLIDGTSLLGGGTPSTIATSRPQKVTKITAQMIKDGSTVDQNFARRRTGSDGGFGNRTTLLQQRKQQAAAGNQYKHLQQGGAPLQYVVYQHPVPSHQPPTAVNGAGQGQDVSESMAAFLTGEALSNHQSMSESDIHHAMELAQQRQQVANAARPAQKVPTALSIEEQRLLQSLDRLNERLRVVTDNSTSPASQQKQPNPPNGSRGQHPSSALHRKTASDSVRGKTHFNAATGRLYRFY
ncbi:uncharacterized protein LOC106157875 isoform X2 [Lingula anatina]|uniref:Uncharacterized protein LOC106157875 isoform X2 n=1 Tax=Lingula anatina TaxID=7574 RepID=A0A1S3HU96_LINAN|nr:uncharacterized protein LOC106157875 isoform X2 [Lingula anatina]|eukprot:XP_013389116.1 uncharacterized protein LOC106157875 isoform X2 [Lingula anatina]